MDTYNHHILKKKEETEHFHLFKLTHIHGKSRQDHMHYLKPTNKFKL